MEKFKVQLLKKEIKEIVLRVVHDASDGSSLVMVKFKNVTRKGRGEGMLHSKKRRGDAYISCIHGWDKIFKLNDY
jgi:hypothetical protein